MRAGDDGHRRTALQHCAMLALKAARAGQTIHGTLWYSTFQKISLKSSPFFLMPTFLERGEASRIH